MDGRTERRAYVINELENSLSVLDIDAADGTLSPAAAGNNTIPYEVRDMKISDPFSTAKDQIS